MNGRSPTGAGPAGFIQKPIRVNSNGQKARRLRRSIDESTLQSSAGHLDPQIDFSEEKAKT